MKAAIIIAIIANLIILKIYEDAKKYNKTINKIAKESEEKCQENN